MMNDPTDFKKFYCLLKHELLINNRTIATDIEDVDVHDPEAPDSLNSKKKNNIPPTEVEVVKDVEEPVPLSKDINSERNGECVDTPPSKIEENNATKKDSGNDPCSSNEKLTSKKNEHENSLLDRRALNIIKKLKITKRNAASTVKIADRLVKLVTKDENVPVKSQNKNENTQDLISLLSPHTDDKCCYYPMMKVAIKVVQNYLKEYTEIPDVIFKHCKNIELQHDDTPESAKINEKSELCFRHHTALPIYEKVVGLQEEFNYVYLPHLDKKYHKAVKDIMSQKIIAILLFGDDLDSHSQLPLIVISTPKISYAIDLLASRGGNLPSEIKDVLQTRMIVKLLFNAQQFCKYFEAHNIKILNMVDLKACDTVLRCNLAIMQKTVSSLIDFVKGMARNSDKAVLNTKEFDAVKWSQRPIKLELFEMAARICWYLHKAYCCIELAKNFLNNTLVNVLLNGKQVEL